MIRKIESLLQRAFHRTLQNLSTMIDFGYDRNSYGFSANTALVTRKPIAVFTRTYNEGALLLLWERYWGNEIGYENIYVINNGGTDSSCNELDKRTSVINLPLTEVSHKNWAILDGFFQRFLLHRYEWVIKTDADEIYCSEGNIVSILEKNSHGIYTPEFATAIIHRYQDEPSLNFNAPIGMQRNHFVKEPETSLRPQITSLPTTWSPGNHFAHEGSQVMRGIWQFHLHCVDFDRLVTRHKTWLEMKFSKDDFDVLNGLSAYKANLGTDALKITRSDFDDHLRREIVTLPGNIESKLNF